MIIFTVSNSPEGQFDPQIVRNWKKKKIKIQGWLMFKAKKVSSTTVNHQILVALKR